MIIPEGVAGGASLSFLQAEKQLTMNNKKKNLSQNRKSPFIVIKI